MRSQRFGVSALAVLLLVVGSAAIGQESLKGIVEQEGLSWMIGSWKGTTDNGEDILITHEWAVDGHVITTGLQMGEVSSQGMIYFDADVEQVKQFSVNNRGQATQGTWESDYGKAVCRTAMKNEYGESTDVGIVYSRVNATTIKIAVYGLEYGQMADDAWFEMDFHKVTASPKGANCVSLFNGTDLAGWTYYLVEPDKKMADVWSVRDGLLICQGKPMGYLATQEAYTNFHLIVEWRWAPGKKPSNSGVLLRITGEPKALPRCAEAQLQSGKAGDIYGFHGFQVKGDEARSRTGDGDMTGKLSGVSKIKGNENEPGQWNKYEITLIGGNLTLMINGEKVNEATGLDIVAGNIGLQSEGGEIHFRTVKLFPLD
jgi:hypothetical protein